MAGRATTLARAVTIATTSLALGAGSHVLAGGPAAPAGVLAVLGSLLLVGALGVSRRRLSARSLVPLVVVAQALVHAVLTWVHQASALAVPAGLSPATSHGAVHGAVTAHLVADAAAVHLGPTMLLAHGAATLVTVAAVLGADRAAARARHWWSGVLVLTRGAVVVPRVAPPRPAATPDMATVSRLARSIARRGPPAASATA